MVFMLFLWVTSVVCEKNGACNTIFNRKILFRKERIFPGSQKTARMVPDGQGCHLLIRLYVLFLAKAC